MLVSHRRGRTGPAVDPVALLKREHEMILDQLRMIEAILGPRSAGRRRAENRPEPDRETLRELLRFFTSRVGVHFKREAVLITTLRRVLGCKPEERDQFDTLLLEHRLLRADAAGIVKKLSGKAARASASGADPCGIRSFVRQYRGHLACEERILYVLAAMRLSAEQKLRVSRRMLQV